MCVRVRACVRGRAQFANKDVLCMIIIHNVMIHCVITYGIKCACVRVCLRVHVFVCLRTSCGYQCHFKSLSVYNHQGQKALSPSTEINKSGWQQIKQRGEQSHAWSEEQEKERVENLHES